MFDDLSITLFGDLERIFSETDDALKLAIISEFLKLQVSMETRGVDEEDVWVDEAPVFVQQSVPKQL